MDALAALRLQIDWGADEALLEAPLDRLAPQDAAAPTMPAEGRPAPALPPRAAAPTATPPVSQPAIPPAGGSVVSRAQAVAAAAGTIEELRAALEAFDDCPLRRTAGSLVFADGNPDAGLMLVGEAPGAEEDLLGKPFVGASGQLLDRMMASIGLDRSQALITNLIPWRPPGNRPPTDSEVLTCLPFLLRHIILRRPRRLVLLGALAARSVIGAQRTPPARVEGIRRLRGRWVALDLPGLAAPLPALPMLHPAGLLRDPGAKREAWLDWLLLRRTLDEDGARTRDDDPTAGG
jgi:DNA polymerase